MRPAALLLVAIPLAACAGAPVSASAAPTTGPTARPAATASAGAGGSATLGEQRSEGGGVEVIAAWSTADLLSLKLTMDTHSVDLDRSDPMGAIKLRLDGGDWISPTAADVPKGGHHRSGTLTFASVPPAAFASARLIELRVTDVGVPERILRWERAG